MKRETHYRASFKEIVGILFENSKNIRVLFPLELVFVALDGFLASRIPVLLKFFVDGLEKDSSLFLKGYIFLGLFYTLLISILWYISAVIQHYLKEKISTNLMINVQSGLYQHLQKLSLDFYQNTYIGEITSRLTSDIYQSVKELYNAFMHSVWLVFLLVPSMWTMIKFNLTFFYIFLMFMFFFGILLKTVLPLIRKNERSVQDQRGRINAKITEHIYAINLIKAFAREKHASDEVNREFKNFLTKALASSRVQIIFNDFLNMFVSFLAPGLLLFFGVLMRLTTGELVAFFSYWNVAGARVRSLLEIVNRIFTALASFDRIIEFFNKSPLVKDHPGSKQIKVTEGRIEFKNVSFNYPFDDREIIKNFSLVIEPMTKVALVGKSGAGKTTILNLLLRFYDPVCGSIFIDGHNIIEIEQNSLRQNIGVVLQDTVLLNATIKENMLFVKSDATEQEIVDALKKAQIWDYITTLPDKLETKIGERGVKLSGGQRQRISIARVFLKDPAIVLFDEATSNLDSTTEQEIYKTINKLLINRTSLIITHRLSTIHNADKIAVIDKGELVDFGSHEELLEKSAFYKSLLGDFGFFLNKM